MNPTKFELETITPMFMAGADQQNQIELRPPSLKGMLRFWWRAMQEIHQEKLLEKESKMLGGTGNLEGKSAVILTCNNYHFQTRKEYLLPHKLEGSKSPANAIPAGQRFDCMMRFRNMAIQDEIIAAFDLAILLGGFGRRSRRGFGSLAYRTSHFNDIKEVSTQLVASSKILNKNIPFVVNDSNVKRILLTRTIKENSPEYPRIWNVFIGQHGLDDYHKLLVNIGKSSSKYDNNALGNGKPRMACPVIVSVIRIGSMYHPIITQLTSHFENSYRVKPDYKDIQQKFIDEVIA